MGSPDAAYKTLMHDYIQNSFKMNKALTEKYTSDYLYSLSVEDLEDIVKAINPDTPMYNAMMAGVVLNNWTETACNDELNAVCARLEDYMDLFGIERPEKLVFKE